MTDFTPDFGAAPQGYEAAGGPLFLGLDPLLVALLLALIAIAGAVGWALGKRERREDDPDAVAKAIHARILAASRAALSAESDRLIEKSRALKTLVDQLLGDAVKLGAGIDAPLRTIEDVLEGKPAKPAPGGAGGTGAAPPAPAVQTPIISVTVNPAPAPPSPPPPPLAASDQTAQLAAAVRKFHDHWSKTSLRTAELKNARAQLSKTPAEDPHAAHGRGHHGDQAHEDGHDDGHGADAHDPAADHAADRRPIWERRKKTKKG